MSASTAEACPPAGKGAGSAVVLLLVSVEVVLLVVGHFWPSPKPFLAESEGQFCPACRTILAELIWLFMSFFEICRL